MTTGATYGLDPWVTRLANAELPVLGTVMRDINRLTRDSDTSANALAEVILRDASLTTKVLRIANSIHFNPYAEQEMTTISRAVLKLGFRSIKAIGLSVMLIDSLLKRGARQRMLEWLARGFHAAVQAEQLAVRQDQGLKEEVFIGALLMHLGDLAFWSCRDERMATLDQELGPVRNNEALEQQLLGMSLRELSRELVRIWDMGDTLKQALADTECPSLAARLVRLGDEISLASEQGWDSEVMVGVLDQVAALTGQSRDEARTMVMRGAEEAANVAITFGANKLCHYIPSTSEPMPPQPVISKADPQLQLKILRELAAMIHERVDANTMFQMVVEGIHRGVGLERVALCLIDPGKKTVNAKYVLGNTGTWRQSLSFSVRGAQDNLAAYCIHTRQVIWAKASETAHLRHLLDGTSRQLMAVDNCILAPLYAGQRQVGLLLADRGPRGEPIDQNQYDSFCHFAQQTNMGLAMLASQAAKKSPTKPVAG